MQSGMGKRAEKRRARKGEFMKAAAKVFLDMGLRDATMDDVAAGVGVSKVVLYRYFASKEDLVDSILEQMTRRLLHVDRLPWEGYEAAILRSVAVAWEDPAAYILLAREAGTDNVFRHHHETIWTSVADRLIAAFEGFGLDSEHARMSGEAMTAYVISVIIHWLQNGSPDRDEAFATWAAAGTHAMDRQWRKLYGRDKTNNTRTVTS